MILKPTRKELLECTTNAVMRFIKEGKSNRFNQDGDYKNKEINNKKSPKHSKMKPQGKDKYKNDWEQEVE